MLPFLDAYLHAILRSQLISPWDIDDQRILESDWLGSDFSEQPDFSRLATFADHKEHYYSPV